MAPAKPSILILGTRGVPAAHGGFETFAERLALFLVSRGWHVGVYCQEEVATVEKRVTSDLWQGIERLTVQVASTGPRATLEFDWHCVRDAARRSGVCLVLGYNGAVFLPYLRYCGRPIITNMDGIEWRRPKWSFAVRVWFWVNEWIAAWSSHRLVADNPEIARHLATRSSRSRSVMIPYGGVPVRSAPEEPVRALGLEPDRYLIAIARIEPDNNILMLVEAFSKRKLGVKLLVLGDLNDANPYHRRIRSVASDDVVFAGAVYDQTIVQALRFHARAYLHGHSVGGTNPSLVEALWAGNPVIAHDNPYNRWTAGEAAIFFKDRDGCGRAMEAMIRDQELVARCRRAATARAAAAFDWREVLTAYEQEAIQLLGQAAPAGWSGSQPAASRPL